MYEMYKVEIRVLERDSPSWVNMDKYKELNKQKLVQIKKHPVLPLTLLNYTPKTQMKKKWCAEILQARGLVVAEHSKIIERPLPKFFNNRELTGSPLLDCLKCMRKWMVV